MPLSFPDFREQDLRNRCFIGHQLIGADFRGADLRGCDFRRAILTNARFEGCRFGQTWRQRGWWLLLILVTIWLVSDALGRLIFGAIGETSAEKTWNYVLLLYGFLGVASFSRAIGLFSQQHWLKRGAEVLLSGTIGVLIGFFYGGYWTSNNALIAILTAIIVGVLAVLLNLRLQSGTQTIILTTAGTITTYAFTFLVAARAFALLMADRLLPGMLLGVVSLIVFWLTIYGLNQVIATVCQTPGTLFRQAVLTDAQFSPKDLTQGDFRGAIAPPEAATNHLDL